MNNRTPTPCVFLTVLLALAGNCVSQDFPYIVVDSTNQYIRGRLRIATNNLKDGKIALDQSLCPQAERNVIVSHANWKLARFAMEDFHNIYPKVRAKFPYTTKQHVEHFQKEALDRDTEISAIDRDWSLFKAKFIRQCPNHTRVIEYETLTNLPPSTYKSILNNVATHGTEILGKDGPVALSTNAPNPLSEPDLQQALKCREKCDVTCLMKLLEKYPNNLGLRLMIKNCLPNVPPDVIDKYLDCYLKGDKECQENIRKQYSGLPMPPGAGQGTGVTPSTDIGPNIPPNFAQYTKDGKWVTNQVLIAYVDTEGGQIGSEVINKRIPKLDAQNTVIDVDVSEVSGSKVKWALNIRAGTSVKVGDGFSNTFTIVDESSPPSEFEVTGWQMPDGTRKDTAQREMKIDFPKAGDYTIKVFGITGRYRNPFAVTLPVRY